VERFCSEVRTRLVVAFHARKDLGSEVEALKYSFGRDSWAGGDRGRIEIYYFSKECGTAISVHMRMGDKGKCERQCSEVGFMNISSLLLHPPL